MADRIKVRIRLGCSARVAGELVDLAPGDELELDSVEVRKLVSANFAELVDPPKPFLDAKELEQTEREKREARQRAEDRAQGRTVEAAVDEAPEKAARTGRASGRG